MFQIGPDPPPLSPNLKFGKNSHIFLEDFPYRELGIYVYTYILFTLLLCKNHTFDNPPPPHLADCTINFAPHSFMVD